MFVHVPQTRAWVLDVLTSLHTFNDFEPGEFLTFLFLQCFLNGFCKHFVGGNRDIFQRVGALLGFLNVRCQPVGGVFNHGKLNGQLFHFVESGLCLIQRLGSSIIGVGRHTGDSSDSTRGISVPIMLRVLMRIEFSTGTEWEISSTT